jgi:hypothetical protein
VALPRSFLSTKLPASALVMRDVFADLELVCRSYLRTTAHDSKSVVELVHEAGTLLKKAAKTAAKNEPEGALALYEDSAYRLFAAASHPQQDGPGQAALREVLGAQLATTLGDVPKLKVLLYRAACHANGVAVAVAPDILG